MAKSVARIVINNVSYQSGIACKADQIVLQFVQLAIYNGVAYVHHVETYFRYSFLKSVTTSKLFSFCNMIDSFEEILIRLLGYH